MAPSCASASVTQAATFDWAIRRACCRSTPRCVCAAGRRGPSASRSIARPAGSWKASRAFRERHPRDGRAARHDGQLLSRRARGRALLALVLLPIGGRAPPAAPVTPAERNAGTFEACFKAFGQGRLVAIYPEGTTHAEARVQRIKTGAARLALGYEAERPGALRVIPVGLNFDARKSFRGRVL